MPWSSWHGGVWVKVGLSDLVKVFTVKMDKMFFVLDICSCVSHDVSAKIHLRKNSLLQSMFLYPDYFLTPPASERLII